MRDVTPAFILTELIALLRQEKIVRPGYRTLQAVIGKALSAERRRQTAEAPTCFTTTTSLSPGKPL